MRTLSLVGCPNINLCLLLTFSGGPRRVVLLLPDGNLMVTEVDEEQFAALELEK